MNFGRQNNLSRRANRADETFHRGKHRKGVDRVAMLDLVKAGPPRPSAARRSCPPWALVPKAVRQTNLVKGGVRRFVATVNAE